MVGIVGYSIYQSTIYITYRGTANFENIYEDIQFTQVPFGARNPIPCNNCYSHAGFLDCHTATLAGIWKGFLDLQKTYPTFQVVVTGWSLGGAVASLMAVDMSVGNLYKNNCIYIVFGHIYNSVSHICSVNLLQHPCRC